MCREFCLLLLFIFVPVWGLFQEDGNIKIKNYYIGSSRISSSEHKHRVRSKRDVLVSSRPEFLFDLQLYNDGRPFPVYIRQRDSDVLGDKTTFLKISNASDTGYDSYPVDFRKYSHLYEGYLVDNRENSSVSGYVKDDHFYGHIIVNDTFYYVDEIREFIDPDGSFDVTERNALIFKRDSVTIGMFLSETKSAKMLFKELLKKNYYHNEFRKWKGNGKLCPMVILIDNSFLTVVHKSDIEAAIFHVLFSLEEANAVFRSTDFDGDGKPDNIGFYVKKMVLIATEEPPYFIPKYQEEAIGVNDYLFRFMRYKELANHCVGVAFTAQKFDHGTLGASFTPESTSLYPTSGICDGHVSNIGTMNGLVITASTFRSPLVHQVVFEVTITHELGHSFGSLHDQEPKCFGHVMSPKSFADYYGNRTHLVFSPCSREHIMRTLVMKGHCLEPVQTSFCGNGIVENGEDCDCGLTRDCLEKDPCCVPRRTREYPCKINKKKGFQCHPSQGKCCSKDCKYSTQLDFFVNCRNFELTCPCKNNEVGCSCGLNGVCVENECHSSECFRLGLEECRCRNETLPKICQTCCRYQNGCISAGEATGRVLRLAQSMPFSDEKSTYQSKQFVSKKYCLGDRCANLRFLRGKPGEYCLYKGKLGVCQPNLQCTLSEFRQSFPSFESTCAKSFNFLSRLIVLLIQSILLLK